MPFFSENFLLNKYIFLIIFNFLFFTGTVCSQILKVDDIQRFERLNTDHGLPHNGIHGIFNDSKGFMWFATGEGLCKFDGYKYQTYRYSLDDAGSISNENIFDIDEDKNGDLWISTYSGINKFNRKYATFSAFYVDKKDIETSYSTNFFLKTEIDPEGNIWSIVADRGLVKFDPKQQKFEDFTFPENFPGNLKNRDISSFFINESGNIWFISGEGNKSNGVFYYDPKLKSLKSYIHNPKDPESLSDKGLTDIIEDKNGNIWISLYEGLEKLNPVTGKVSHFFNPHKQAGNLFSGRINDLVEDDEGMIWVGTQDQGLIKFDPENNQCYQYKNEPKNKKSISLNFIISVFYDKKGILWIGTDKGLNYVNINRKNFQNYLFASEEDEISSSNQITDLYTDKDSLIWFCTEKGLHKYDGFSAPELVYPYSCDELVQDQNGKFYLIGNGLKSFDPVTKEITEHTSSLNTNTIWSLYKDHEDIIWLGTGGGGLNTLDLKTGKATYYLYDPNDSNSISTNEVGPILRTGNELWLGPFKGGLNKIDLKTGNISRWAPNPKDQESLSHNIVNAIHKDKKGRMWVGTYQGLNVLDEKGEKFRRIKQKDGLSSEHISVNGIVEDKNGNIWVSTSAGISRIHPQTFAIRNYDSRDGFQKNPKATLFKNRDGIIFMYGQNGITSFQPEEMKDNALPPKIAITDFLIFNKSVSHSEESFLKEEISETRNINLTYKESSITFEFAALSYVLPEKNQYAYMMEGFDEDWINSGAKRYATYTNLPAGKTYNFKVKASNNDGVWNETGTYIQLYITPPFWQTWWFKSLIILSVFSGAVAFYKVRINLIKQQKVLLEKQVEERTAEVVMQKEELSTQAGQLLLANNEITLQSDKLADLYKEMKDSIRAAEVIQNAMLPSLDFIRQHLPESFILNLPKDVVSGDFYWFHVIDHKIIIAAVDCTGHGVSGAFMSITGHHLLNQSLPIDQPLKASKILNKLNEGVQKELHFEGKNDDVQDGMDVALCILDKEKKELQFAGANNPLYILRGGEIIQVKGNKFSVGLFVGNKIPSFTNHHIQLQTGDIVYIFSDGYADQVGGVNGMEKYMYPRFRSFLLSIAGKDMDAQAASLEENIRSWRNTSSQLDDILVIGFKI